MKNNVRYIIAFLLIAVGILILLFSNNDGLEKLPKPEITGGERGTFGIDKNINEETIDKYLNRSD